jgi:zinc protease
VNRSLKMIYILISLMTLSGIFPLEALAVKRTKLANNLTILTNPLATNSIVSVVVSLKMGSLYETDDKAGLFNLLQETIIKGTKKRTSEQIALELESMGTRLSSSTDREYGTIAIQSTSVSLYKSLDVLYDIILNATFPQDAVDLQKKLQVRNILIRHDQPLTRAVELMVEAHYGAHPFHKPLLGYPETIGKLTRDDLVKTYREIYIPNNMVISVVGNFEEKRLIDDISRAFDSFAKGPVPEVVSGEMPVSTGPVEKVETRETAASWFALGWSSPVLNDPDYYPMEMLDSITGGSMNSRLFIAIREKRGLAYQVSSFVNSRLASGLYAAYIGTKPSTYEEAKKVLIEEIFRMKNELASPEEITLSKNYLHGMYIMSLESNAGQASQNGHYEILGLGYEFADQYPVNIENVSGQDILRVAKKYLTENYSLGGVLAKIQ